MFYDFEVSKSRDCTYRPPHAVTYQRASSGVLSLCSLGPYYQPSLSETLKRKQNINKIVKEN